MATNRLAWWILQAGFDLERQMDLIALESSQKEEKNKAATSQLAELKAGQESLREELEQKVSSQN